jgi:FKBP-type peptidyl-prolyl cis-trans isomerase FkpA
MNRITRTSIIVSTCALAGACDSAPKSDPRADSLAAAAAAQARTDSIEAIQLVTADTNIAPSLGIDLSKMEKKASGLYLLERRRGTGAVADSGKWIQVHYTTWLPDGTVLDDTRKSGGPRRVLLGFDQVVKAWEEGLRGMRVGGRRVMVAPASLAYGKPGRPGSVPRLATLVFDIELVRVY